MAKKGLGRGLDALLADNSIEERASSGGITLLKLSDVEPNRAQARKRFDEPALLELADSIRLHGVLQPITVRRKQNGYYEIIAGERRWRASKIAGLSEIPALVREADDLQASEMSLIENLQREDLNAAEEARGYRDLIEKFGLTQEEAAAKVGKSRTAVANLLRILKLPGSVLAFVEDGSLSYGHARALIPLAQTFDEATVESKARIVINADLSVRQTENMVKKLLSGENGAVTSESAVGRAYYGKLERDLSDSLGRKVSIKRGVSGKGQVCLSFSDPEDLENLITGLCGEDFFESND
ncbi:MAG: ParB/RepB/Spo0J family partition protein [Clostridia bacterium]|nr:ParB/RepB/Spo0J family partition protein [Clostridia bacterium]